MDLNQFVEHHGGISVIRGGETVRAWNGIQYQAGLSGKNTSARQLSMNIATVPRAPSPSRTCTWASK